MHEASLFNQKLRSDIFNDEKERKRLEEMRLYDLDKFDKSGTGIDSILELVAKICKTPISNVNLVMENEIVSYSKATSYPRHNSFCNIAISHNEALEINDTTADEKFKDNPLVNCELPIRFYAAYPLISPNGNNFGTLNVCDYIPRKLDEVQLLTLRVLSQQIMFHFEMRRQNKLLEDTIRKASRLSKSKDEFMTNINHDLRTPLNAINGYSEILIQTNLDAKQYESAYNIKYSSEILLNLVNDLYDLSIIEFGKLKLNKQLYNFHQEMSNLHNLLKYKARDKTNFEFEFNLDEKIPQFIVGDKLRINQVLMNLIGNAIKFTENGFVILDVKLLEETDTNVLLEFSIKDTGIGIPEDKLNLIFERFEQASNEIANNYGGTGLGLNISKSIIELHNSKLYVTSNVNKGSHFYFKLRLDKNGNESLNKSRNKHIPKFKEFNFNYFKGMNILVCEDNSLNIKLIRNLFANLECQLTIAENGKVALKILKNNNNFDFILMDIHMPEMNGLDLTRYIRKVLKLPISIIGFSAGFSHIEKENLMKSGMNDVITKTFKHDLFFKELIDALKSKRYFNNAFDSILPRNICSSTKCNTLIEMKLKEKMSHLNNNFKVVSNENYQKNIFKIRDKQIKQIKEELKVNCITNLESKKVIPVTKAKSSPIICSTSDTMKISNQTNEKLPRRSENQLINKNNINSKLQEFFCDDFITQNEFIKLFINDIPKELTKLENSINSMTMESIKFITHKIKGTLMMFELDIKFLRSGFISTNFEKIELLKEFNKFKLDVDNIVSILQDLLV